MTSSWHLFEAEVGVGLTEGEKDSDEPLSVERRRESVPCGFRDETKGSTHFHSVVHQRSSILSDTGRGGCGAGLVKGASQASCAVGFSMVCAQTLTSVLNFPQQAF